MSIAAKVRRNGGSLAAALSLLALATAAVTAQEGQPLPEKTDGQSLLRRALDHMQELPMRLADGGDEVELFDRPILTYGDTARANKNGTMWAFGKTGRPLAVLELYQGVEPNARWVHAVTLTSGKRVKMKTPTGVTWSPEKTQIEPAPFGGVANPDARETARLRQMKDLARRFTAHEFWNPDNSRFELRLLVQPVLRFSDASAQIHDGTAFVLAHGTNPEVVLLVEALGKTLEESRWHYSLARLGSAELHVELDGKEVWAAERTPGVVGQPADPYWLFLSDAKPLEK